MPSSCADSPTGVALSRATPATYRRPLPNISRYTLGTANLSDPTNPEHLRVARRAMDAGIWFHTAAEYGDGRMFSTLSASSPLPADVVQDIDNMHRVWFAI